MKLLFKITLPAEPFNTLARKGVVGKKISAILEGTKPESLYFTGNESGRGAVAIYEVSDGSQIPSLGEPWLMTFDAKIEYSVAISPEEMIRANLDEVIKKWT